MPHNRQTKSSHYYLLTRTFLYIPKRLYLAAVSQLSRPIDGMILDIGAGRSPYRPLFPNAERYIRLDLNEAVRPDIVTNAERLPIADRSVDSVVCSEVLEHAVDPDAVLAEIARVLPSGRLALITAPMSWNLHYEPYDFRRFTCYGLKQLLERHGFELLDVVRVGGLFSLIGARLVEGIASELYRRSSLPPRFKHLALLFFSVPTSLFFMALARLLDGFERTDAIGWAVLARRVDAQSHVTGLTHASKV